MFSELITHSKRHKQTLFTHCCYMYMCTTYSSLGNTSLSVKHFCIIHNSPTPFSLPLPLPHPSLSLSLSYLSLFLSSLSLPPSLPAVVCDWPATPESRKRRSFCSRYEGYGSLCHCSNPLPLTTSTPPLPQNHIKNIPVAIIASNRPQYLFR